HARAIADIDERHAAEVANPVHPAEEHRLAADIASAQGAAGMSSRQVAEQIRHSKRFERCNGVYERRLAMNVAVSARLTAVCSRVSRFRTLVSLFCRSFSPNMAMAFAPRAAAYFKALSNFRLASG